MVQKEPGERAAMSEKQDTPLVSMDYIPILTFFRSVSFITEPQKYQYVDILVKKKRLSELGEIYNVNDGQCSQKHYGRSMYFHGVKFCRI